MVMNRKMSPSCVEEIARKRSIAYFRTVVVFSLPAILLMGCGQNYRELDEQQLRRQFHIPSEVHLDSLASDPETAGWFGREGLRIRAVFQFTELQFDRYLSDMDNREVWSPETFLNYTPDRAESYSASALRWSELPLPDFPGSLAYLNSLFDTTMRQGDWYCSVLVTVPIEQDQSDGGGFQHAWKTLGIHGMELDENQSPTITTFGILDYERRRLCAWIGFSG